MTQRQQYDMPQALGDNLLGGFEYTGGQNLSRFQRILALNTPPVASLLA
jgi:hypothetical protein